MGIVFGLYCLGEFMKKIIIGLVVLSLLLVGCVRYVDVERNVTIEKIVYRNITTIVKEECNATFNQTWDLSKSKEIEFIRRIRFLEKALDNCVFDEDCQDDLEDTEDDLDDCEDDLDDTEEELDEAIEDLDDCEETLCEDYNVSGVC